ncbi:hypothetical protein CLV63_10191 [Murinocardiopsis flavida]|uniref:Chlorite dismutase n=1 Tax=Murinocardiopsis flavida TaxID=645275 RepID=A0A2P8DTS2_9ACTN|nr:hypothetical protein [Murinocardiopsis flavida]PSL00617.1 hypothetical protein CLV63_10191 [Murinocardiopsis flavida]
MPTIHHDPRYPAADFDEPEPYGLIYLGIAVDPPRRVPFVRGSAQRDDAIEEYKAFARQLEEDGNVVEATVYEAVLIPPITGGPRFDVAVLIRTTTPDTIAAVQKAAPYLRFNADFAMAARNIRRIGETDRTSAGTFLFNHFTAADPEGAVAVWENLTGWYTRETGVDNSTLLQPVDGSKFAFVNYVRLPTGPVRFLLSQFAKPSFFRHVRGHLRSNGMAAMPIMARIA